MEVIRIQNNGAHSASPGFRASAIPLRLVDRCASNHLRPSLSPAVYLGGVMLPAGALRVGKADTRLRVGPLCASHTASMTHLEDEEPPKGERCPTWSDQVEKISTSLWGSLFALFCAVYLVYNNYQKASYCNGRFSFGLLISVFCSLFVNYERSLIPLRCRCVHFVLARHWGLPLQQHASYYTFCHGLKMPYSVQRRQP